MLALQGLAHCFERGDDGGKLRDVFVIEPVSANSLECMVAGKASASSRLTSSLKEKAALQLHCASTGHNITYMHSKSGCPPVPIASRCAGAQTCFKALVGVTLGDAMARDKSKLPEEFADASFCEHYDFRCDATARTWLRPHAQDNLLWVLPCCSGHAALLALHGVEGVLPCLHTVARPLHQVTGMLILSSSVQIIYIMLWH